jgi:hypothetical protein
MSNLKTDNLSAVKTGNLSLVQILNPSENKLSQAVRP